MFPSLMIMMAMQYLNAPYRWGANGPFRFDCSGLVLKVLHDCGLTLPDMTSHDLYKYALRNGKESTELTTDSLLFFGRNGKITHVSISMGEVDGVACMIEAAGAGEDSLEMSERELAERDARVRIKRVDHRSDLVASISLK